MNGPALRTQEKIRLQATFGRDWRRDVKYFLYKARCGNSALETIIVEVLLIA
jgi:hypothetical protein